MIIPRTVTINNKTMTLEKYLTEVALGECTYADSEYMASATMVLGEMNWTMLEAIKKTMKENRLSLEDVRWFPLNQNKFRVRFLIRETEQTQR